MESKGMIEAPTMSTNYGMPQSQCERREEGQTGGDSRRGGTGEGEEKGACGWSARERIHKLNTHARMEEEREGERDEAARGSRADERDTRGPEKGEGTAEQNRQARPRRNKTNDGTGDQETKKGAGREEKGTTRGLKN